MSLFSFETEICNFNYLNFVVLADGPPQNVNIKDLSRGKIFRLRHESVILICVNLEN